MLPIPNLQEAELQAALEEATEAEARASEAEIRMKEARVSLEGLTIWS